MSTHDYRDYRDPPNTIFTLGILAALLMILAGLWLIQYPPLIRLVEQIQIRSQQPLLPEITQQVERRTIIITATPNPETVFLPPPTYVPTETSIPLPTDTPIPLPTETSVPLSTETPIPLPTKTSIPLPTETPIPLPTDTRLPTPTDTSIPLPTETAIALPTETRLPTPTEPPIPSAPPEPTATWVEVDLLLSDGEHNPESPSGNSLQTLVGTLEFFDGVSDDSYGTTIRITGENGQLQTTWVDIDGNFSFVNVPNGEYRLEASKQGITHICIDELILAGDNVDPITLPNLRLSRMSCKW